MPDAIPQLEQLYREIAPDLLAYFRRRPSLRSTAEDLVQDVFVRAFRGFARLAACASPRAYLFGIARHVGLDALRSHRPTTELPAELPAPEAPPTDERLEVMRAAIAALPDLHREALELKLHHELSYEEIAEILAVPIGTVRSRLHHAVAHLRESLHPPGPL
ncbi:MAG: RNA polymerase sigma factor [Verrucomicrobia bacterium]|jgi:RNA polymerase sigma-70 factor (ECF subfamily)|nr:RNA polymerase sigma factor [Verrucomicrobiota bacterium]